MSLVMTGAVGMAHAAAAQLANATNAEGSAVDVDFDLTVLGQMALFVVLLLALKPLLFDPMLKLFEEREKRIEGAKGAGRHLDDESGRAEAEYEAALQQAREEGNAERERLRGEAVKAENDILSRVRESTTKTLDDGRRHAQAEVARVRAALHEQSKDLAREIASRVLGREVER